MNWSTITVTVNGTAWTGLQVCALLGGIGLAIIAAALVVGGVVVASTKKRE